MTDVNDPLQQMRQHQMLTQQAAHFRPLNVVATSSDDLYGSVAASTQNFNGSLSKMIADEGWFRLCNTFCGPYSRIAGVS